MPSRHLRHADDFGLRRALSDRLLPLLVGAMVFLAALAGGGAEAASGLAGHWRDAGGVITVQVPDPDDAAAGQSRADIVAGVLGPPAHRLTQTEVATLLKPWLGEDAARLSVVLPAVYTLPGPLAPGVEAALAQAAPGTLVARGTAWQGRLAVLAGSLKACAYLAMAVVAFVAAALVAVATRAGLVSRREAIEIVHGLGATDGMIAGRFAARVAGLAGGGALAGALAATAVLLGLARLAAPFLPQPGDLGLSPGVPEALLRSLPPVLWGVLAALPLAACLLGWLTAQATVRLWLARLP